MTEPTSKELFKLLAPYLVGTAVTTLLVAVLLLRFTAVGVPAELNVVSFDVIKYTNAQRAVASTFLKPNADFTRANEILLKLPERTRAAIKDIAGSGTLVVLKQAVVQGQTSDITDEVLVKLGLPTDVPTADATAYNLDVAPTLLPLPAKREAQILPDNRQQVLP